jgi:uncharacterized iron-regulated membrane protein
MNIKKGLRKIHLWIGLVSGLILSIIGITGSLYVFEPELAAFFESEVYQLKGKKVLYSNDINIATLIENKFDKKIETIQWPKRGRETYAFKLFEDKNWYYFDQSTGVITKGGKALGNSFFGFILDLHSTLTMGGFGRIITAIATLLFTIIMLTTGVYLWFPHKKERLKSSFKIKWDASNKRLNYDLHNVTGFYFFIPLFLIGLTGAAFYFDTSIQWVIDKITFSETAKVSFWDKNSYKSNSNQGKIFLTTQQALAEMDKHYPDMYKRNLWMTKKDDGNLSFAYQNNLLVHAGGSTAIFLKINPYTGEVISELNPKNLPLGSAIMAEWQLPIHLGEFGGLFTRILWFISGFIPAFLTYTGFKIWYGKFKKKKEKPKPITSNTFK